MSSSNSSTTVPTVGDKVWVETAAAYEELAVVINVNVEMDSNEDSSSKANDGILVQLYDSGREIAVPTSAITRPFQTYSPRRTRSHRQIVTPFGSSRNDFRLIMDRGLSGSSNNGKGASESVTGYKTELDRSESKHSSKRKLDDALKPPAKKAKQAAALHRRSSDGTSGLPKPLPVATAKKIPQRPAPAMTVQHSKASEQAASAPAATVHRVAMPLGESKMAEDQSKAAKDLLYKTKLVVADATKQCDRSHTPTAMEIPCIAPPKDRLEASTWRGRKIVAEKLYEHTSDDESNSEAPCASFKTHMAKLEKRLTENIFDDASEEEPESKPSGGYIQKKPPIGSHPSRNNEGTSDLEKKPAAKIAHPALKVTPTNHDPVPRELSTSMERASKKPADEDVKHTELLYGDLEMKVAPNSNSMINGIAAAGLLSPTTGIGTSLTNPSSEIAFSSRLNKAVGPALVVSPETHQRDESRVQIDGKEEEEIQFTKLPSSTASLDSVVESTPKRCAEQGTSLRKGANVQSATLCLAPGMQMAVNGHSSHSKTTCGNAIPSSSNNSTNDPAEDQALHPPSRSTSETRHTEGNHQPKTDTTIGAEVEPNQDPQDSTNAEGATLMTGDSAARRETWAVHPQLLLFLVALIFVFLADVCLYNMPESPENLSYCFNASAESASRVLNQIFHAVSMGLVCAVVAVYYPFQLVHNGQILDCFMFVFIMILFIGLICVCRVRHGK